LFDLWQASLPENYFFKTYSQARTLREACGGGYNFSRFRAAYLANEKRKPKNVKEPIN
jgi:hypothetical protein